MAVTATLVLNPAIENTTVDAATYTTASLALTGGRLYLLAVAWRNAVTATPGVDVTATQTGATWVQENGFIGFGGSGRRAVLVFRCQPASNVTAAAITVDLAGTESFTEIIVGCVELGGVLDDSVNNGDGAVVQSAVGSGTDDAPIVTLAAMAAGNATFGALGWQLDSGASTLQEAFTPGTNFTEFGDFAFLVNVSVGLACEFFNGQDTTVDGTITDNPGTNPWRMVGFEIAAAGAGITLGQAAETDTVHPLTVAKAVVLGQAAESDSVPGIFAAKAVTLGTGSEADTAPALTIAKTFTLGLASETDSAHQLGATKLAPLGQALEVDAALSLLVTADAGPDLNPLRSTFIEGARFAFVEAAPVVHLESEGRGDGGYYGGYIEGY